MPKRIYIVGGGHAGSSAAIAAARAIKDLQLTKHAVEVHLIDKNLYLTIKPRLYEYELDEARVPFEKFLPALGIYFHQDEVVKIDAHKQYVKGAGNNYPYEALILATGSDVNFETDAYNINSYDASKRFQGDLFKAIDQRKDRTLRIAVLGAGFTGIELATQLPVNIRKYCEESKQPLPDFDISLFNHGETGGSLGENPKSTIIGALNMAGIKRISHVNIRNADRNKVWLEGADGGLQILEFDFVVNTLGQKPNPLVNDLDFPKDKSNRLIVDAHLNLSGSNILFAAGDVASAHTDDTHLALMTCQQGRPQGRHAGYNAVAFLTDNPLKAYRQPDYLTCLDLGAYGSLYTEGWDRKIIFKGADARKYKQHINRERIYPPVNGDQTALYQAGQLVFKSPRETIAHSKFN